jgi:hypothetical protein
MHHLHMMKPMEMNAPDGGAEVLRSGTSTIKRAGNWKVPARLKVQSATGAIKLDFRQATFESNEVDLELEGGTGAVDLVIPEGASADVSGLSQVFGRTSSAVPSESTGHGRHFVVHGVLGTGKLRINYRPKLFGVI